MSPAVLLSRRTRAMRLLLVVVFVVMALRLVQVQEFGHRHYAALSKAQLTQTVTVPPVRGGIYDRNGEVLAETVTRQTVVADPQIIAHPAAVAAALSPLLGIPAATLRSELTEPTGFVYLAHRVPDAVAAAVTKLQLNGINLVPEAQRVVPDGRLAQPVVGTVGWNDAGTSGIEYQYQSMLAGTPGTTDMLESPDGVTLPSGNRSTPAKPGTGLELTLDESVQYVAEQALATEIVASHATGGTAVVMDVKTGDILAMANLQAAHGSGSTGTGSGAGPVTLTASVAATPNTSGPTLVSQSDTLPAGVVEAPSNSAVTQVYEPGSVFKLVTFSAALADGVVTPSSVAPGAGRPAHGQVHLPRRRAARHPVDDRHPDPGPVVEHRDHRGGREASASPASWTRSATSGSASRPGSGSPGSPRAWYPVPASGPGPRSGRRPSARTTR